MLVAVDEAAPELPFVPGEIARGARRAGLGRPVVPAAGGIGGWCLAGREAGVLPAPVVAACGELEARAPAERPPPPPPRPRAAHPLLRLLPPPPTPTRPPAHPLPAP